MRPSRRTCCLMFLVTVALSLAASTLAVPQPGILPPATPFPEWFDQMNQTHALATQYVDFLDARLQAASDGAVHTSDSVAAAQTQIFGHFGETWGWLDNIVWTFRPAGLPSPPPFDTVVTSGGGVGSLSALFLLPIALEPQVRQQLPPAIAAYLSQVPDSEVTAYIYSACFDTTLCHAGFASSFERVGQELLSFFPTFVEDPAGPVNAQEVAVFLYLHTLPVYTGGYGSIVQWMASSFVFNPPKSASLWRPDRPDWRTNRAKIQNPGNDDGEGCNVQATIDCLNAAWAAYQQQLAALSAQYQNGAELAQETLRNQLRVFNEAEAAELKKNVGTTQLDELLMGSRPSSSTMNAYEQITTSYNVLRQQARNNYKMQMDALERALKNGIARATQDAAKAAKECVEEHCPDLAEEYCAAIRAWLAGFGLTLPD